MLNGTMPPFDPEGGMALIAARVVADAALMQLFGTGLARLAYAGPMLTPAVERRLATLLRVAAIAAALALVAWLWLQAAGFEDAVPDLAGVGDVALHTWFGQVLTAQLGLVLLSIAALGRGAPP